MVMPKAKLSLMLLCVIWISWSAALPRPQIEDAFDEPNCGGEMGKPLITPCKDSIKLDSPSNYVYNCLQCEADEPIEWIFNDEVQSAVIYFNNTEDPVRPCGIRLFLVEVTAIQVGAYYCIKKSILDNFTDQIYLKNEELIESVNNNQASSIYIYVNDPNTLLADIPPMINAFQYTEVIIPCKPAMPETEVLLSFNGENYSRDEISSIAPTPTLYDFYNKSIYDDKIGFKLYIVSQPPSLMKCNARDRQTVKTDQYMMTIYFTKANHRLNTPFITSTSRGHVYQNDTFELICEISARPQFNYGEKFSSYRILVIEPQSSYLEVREPSNHYNVREHANKTIQMTASFEGFPEPTFKWYKPNGIEIWETEPNFKIISTEFSTTLKLLSAQLENSGTYKLKGTNGINSKQLEFNVSVISGPQLTM